MLQEEFVLTYYAVYSSFGNVWWDVLRKEYCDETIKQMDTFQEGREDILLFNKSWC